MSRLIGIALLALIAGCESSPPPRQQPQRADPPSEAGDGSTDEIRIKGKKDTAPVRSETRSEATTRRIAELEAQARRRKRPAPAAEEAPRTPADEAEKRYLEFLAGYDARVKAREQERADDAKEREEWSEHYRKLADRTRTLPLAPDEMSRELESIRTDANNKNEMLDRRETQRQEAEEADSRLEADETKRYQEALDAERAGR